MAEAPIEILWTEEMRCPLCGQEWDFDPDRWEGQEVYCSCGRGFQVRRYGDGWRFGLAVGAVTPLTNAELALLRGRVARDIVILGRDDWLRVFATIDALTERLGEAFYWLSEAVTGIDHGFYPRESIRGWLAGQPAMPTAAAAERDALAAWKAAAEPVIAEMRRLDALFRDPDDHSLSGAPRVTAALHAFDKATGGEG